MKMIRWTFSFFLFFIHLSPIYAEMKETIEPIKIAVITSKTGVAASYNYTGLIGVRFAVAMLNEKGGILNRPIELIEIDNQSTPIGSKVAADVAVKHHVQAVIGPGWSSHALASAPVLQQAGIPMISANATIPKLTEIGDYIFRVCFVDTLQGTLLAEFARKVLMAETAITFVNIRSDYSMVLAEQFEKNFTQLGGKITMEIEYQERHRDFRPLLRSIMMLQPDLLFIPSYDEIILLTEHADDLDFRPIILGGDGWPKKGFNQNILGFFSTHWSPEKENKATLAFSQQFNEWQSQQSEMTEHITVDSELALAYDAVYLLADAMTRANHLNPADIRNALAETKEFQGITGEITFDEQGDPIKPVIMMRVFQGKASYYQELLPPDFIVVHEPFFPIN
jgi:branched-chain amino acid transport system substrate-binding protein